MNSSLKTAKRTPWYSEYVNPVRKGWYECEQCGFGVRHYWNGAYWPTDDKKSLATRYRFKWRGLASKP